MLLTLSFKKRLIVEQFQGNYRLKTKITQFKGASRTDVTSCWRFFFSLKRKGEGDGVDRKLVVSKNHEWHISMMFLSYPPCFILLAVVVCLSSLLCTNISDFAYKMNQLDKCSSAAGKGIHQLTIDQHREISWLWCVEGVNIAWGSARTDIPIHPPRTSTFCFHCNSYGYSKFFLW